MDNKGSIKFLKDYGLTIIIAISFIVFGFIYSSEIGLYICGIAFFLSGLFVTLKDKDSTLIFLFSHGLIGYIIMIASLKSTEGLFIFYNRILKHPIFTDKSVPFSLIAYYIIEIIIIASAIGGSIWYHYLDNNKKKNYYISIILFLYLIELLLIVLFPKVFPQLVK